MAMGFNRGDPFLQLVHGRVPFNAVPCRIYEVVAVRGRSAGVGDKRPKIRESGQIEAWKRVLPRR